MNLKDYLDILAVQFPKSRWNVVGGDNWEGAVLDIDPFQLKVCLFPQGFKHFPAGAVTLSLHAGSHLVRMYGANTVTSDGKITRCSIGATQFAEAADALCSELLGVATAILAITDDQPAPPERDVEARRPPAPHVPRR